MRMIRDLAHIFSIVYCRASTVTILCGDGCHAHTKWLFFLFFSSSSSLSETDYFTRYWLIAYAMSCDIWLLLNSLGVQFEKKKEKKKTCPKLGTHLFIFVLVIIISSMPFVVLPTSGLFSQLLERSSDKRNWLEVFAPSPVALAKNRRCIAIGSSKWSPGLTLSFGCGLVVVGVAGGEVRSNVGIVIKLDNDILADVFSLALWFVRGDRIWSPCP